MPSLRQLLTRRARPPMSATLRVGYGNTWSASGWGYTRTINSVLANPTGFRCIETIVNNLSRPAWEVRQPGTDTPIPDHPLLRVLNRPGDGMSATGFQRFAGRDLELAGKSVWLKVRGKDSYGDHGPLTGLRRLPIDRVTVFGNPDDELVGFVYRNRAGMIFPFLAADVLYLHHPHPERAYDGLAPALIAGLGAETDTVSSRFNFDLLSNDGGLPGYITVEGLSPEQFLEWKATWESGENPGRTRFLSGTANYHKVGMTNEELAYSELRLASQADIYKAFGIAKVLIEPEGATFANVRQAKALVFQSTILPKLVLLADEMTAQIGDDEGAEIGFDLSRIEEIHEGLAALVERSVPLLDRGVVTPNEVRTDMGLAPVAWGDLPVVATEPPQSRPGGPKTVLPAPPSAFPPMKALKAPQDVPGVMVALFLDDTSAESLAVAGGEEASDLHITLAYLGDSIDVNRDALEQAVASFATTATPLTGAVSGYGRFDQGEHHILYASVDIPDLPEWRQRLIASLEAFDLSVDHTHGLSPHVTLAEVSPDSPDLDMPPRLHLAFDRVTVACGADRQSFQLGGSTKALDEDARLATFYRRQAEVIASRIRGQSGKSISKACAPEQWWDGPRWDADLALVTTKGTGINDVTRKALGDLIESAVEQGSSAHDIATAVEHYFAQKGQS